MRNLLRLDRVLCATTPVQLALLTGSRVSAGVLFASLTISIFFKCYATRAYLHHSWLGAVLDFEPSHDVHTCECNELAAARETQNSLVAELAHSTHRHYLKEACATVRGGTFEKYEAPKSSSSTDQTHATIDLATILR